MFEDLIVVDTEVVSTMKNFPFLRNKKDKKEKEKEKKSKSSRGSSGGLKTSKKESSKMVRIVKADDDHSQDHHAWRWICLPIMMLF